MGIVFRNKPRVEVARHEVGVRQQCRLERNIGADSADHKAIQGISHFGNGLSSVTAMDDEFGNHGVIKHGDLPSLHHTGIHTHAHQLFWIGLEHGLYRRSESNQSPGGGQEIAKGIFRIDAAFDGPTIALDFRLLQAQFFSGSDSNHPLHQVQSGDAFGHRVFNLETGIHL